MQKTVTVRVEKKFRHPTYKKVIIRHKKFKVHTENGAKVGDMVRIVETRPISKDVRFAIMGEFAKTENLKDKKEKLTIDNDTKEVVKKKEIKAVRKTARKKAKK